MKTTDNLTQILKKAYPDQMAEVLACHEEEMVSGDRLFAAFMRQQLKGRNRTQQEVFLAADIPERYGYKLLSEQKRTRQRDIILRLCFAARLSLEEMQRALELYGFGPLYARVPRDAVLMVAANRGITEIPAVNEMLEKHGQVPLRPCGQPEDE